MDWNYAIHIIFEAFLWPRGIDSIGGKRANATDSREYHGDGREHERQNQLALTIIACTVHFKIDCIFNKDETGHQLARIWIVKIDTLILLCVTANKQARRAPLLVYLHFEETEKRLRQIFQALRQCRISPYLSLPLITLVLRHYCIGY